MTAAVTAEHPARPDISLARLLGRFDADDDCADLRAALLASRR